MRGSYSIPAALLLAAALVGAQCACNGGSMGDLSGDRTGDPKGDDASTGDDGESGGDAALAGDGSAAGDAMPTGDATAGGDADNGGDSGAGTGGDACSSDSDCAAGFSCECADPTCSTRVCNASACTGCTFTDGSGGCDAGHVADGRDPNDACRFACNGSGRCRIDENSTVELFWDRLFDAKYAYNVVTTSGSEVGCNNMDLATDHVFDGTCNQPGQPDVPLTEVAAFRFYTSMDCWVGSECTVGMIEVAYTGQEQIRAHESPPANCPDLAMPEKPNDRHWVVNNLANPDVFNDGCRLLLTGTDGRGGIPIFSSSSAVHHSFSKIKTYYPSPKDPAYDYCFTWPHTIERIGGLYVMLFSANRGGEGEGCPSGQGTGNTGFAAFAGDDLEFGTPFEVWFPEGSSAPHTSTAVSDELAMRIDQRMYYDDVSHRWWLAYVWFNWSSAINEANRGNWISSFAVDNPTNVITNVWPEAAQYHVTEAPELFRMGSKYFLILSHNKWYRAYAMKYLESTGIDGLVRGTVPLKDLYTPVCHVYNNSTDCGGIVDPVIDPDWIDAAGAPSALRVNGETFLYYHVLRHVDGVCDDPANPHYDPAAPKASCRRDTVVSKLAFDNGDSPYRLNGIEVSWSPIGQAGVAKYGLDILTTDSSSWIAPCVGLGTGGSSGHFFFDGACADRQFYPKGKVRKLRIFAAPDGTWVGGEPNVSLTVDYNGYADSVSFGPW